MKIFNTIILIIGVVVIILLLIYCIKKNIKKPGSFDTTIIVALIGSLTAIISIVGSVYVNQNLSNENARQQRAIEVRKIKQEYYHQFTESFLLRIAFHPNQNSPEFKEADKTFCIEKSRLPLYASQEIVEYIEKVVSDKSPNTDFKTLYEMIRRDLLSDEFVNFENLKQISILLPTESTRKGSDK